jgi:adenosine deaminase
MSSFQGIPLEKMPKADGHVHFNGLIDDESVTRLIHKYGLNPATYSPYITETGRRVWPNYKFFHEAYDAGVSLLRKPEDLHDIGQKQLMQNAQGGCVYMDIFASGMNNYRGGDAWPVFRDNNLAMLQAMSEVQSETDLESSLVITFKRHLKDAVRAAHQLVDLTLRFKESGFDPENRINAFHLAGDEERDTCPPFSVFAPVYKRAAVELGMNRNGTHVGEVKPSEDIWHAIAIPEISRFGHALSAVSDEKLMEEIRRQGIPIEILLTSNTILLGHKPMNHAVHTFLAHDIDIILGSDDPGILGSSIANEYKRASEEFQLTEKQLFNITINTVRHGFAPWQRRQAVLDRLAAFDATYGMKVESSVFHLNPPAPEKMARRNDLTAALNRRFAIA